MAVVLASPYRDVQPGAEAEATFHKRVPCGTETHEEGCTCRDLFYVAGRLFRRKEIDFGI